MSLPPPTGSLGRPDITFTIFNRQDSRLIGFHSRQLGEEALFDAAEAALRGEPLRLTTQASRVLVRGEGENLNLLGIADYRASPILSHWFERVTVRVDVIRISGTRRVPDFRLDVSTALYVSKQNSPRNIDWTLPTPQQEIAYLDVIQKSLRQRLSRACENPKWENETLMVCESKK